MNNLNSMPYGGTVAKKMINFFNRQHDLGFFLDKMKERAVTSRLLPRQDVTRHVGRPSKHRCVRGLGQHASSNSARV